MTERDYSTVGMCGATYIFQLSRAGWSVMGFPSWCVDYRRWAGRGQDAVELAAGADGELGEDFAQVVLDGVHCANASMSISSSIS